MSESKADMFTMFTCLRQLVLIYTFSLLVWRVLRKYLNPCPLGNITGPTPSSLFTGSIVQLLHRRTGWKYHRDIAAEFGQVMRVKGFLGESQLYTFDLRAMYHIFVKDQDAFEETPFFTSFFRLTFGEGLFGTLGEQHKKQRKMLNPVFSIDNLCEMVPIFYNVSHKLIDLMSRNTSPGPFEVDIASYTNRLALELIAQAGIGHSFDNFDERQATHPYAKAAASLMPSFYPLRMVAPFLVPFIRRHGHPKFCRILMDWIPFKALHQFRDIVDVMDLTIRDIYSQNKKALLKGDAAQHARIGEGKDIMSVLMRANMSASTADSLSESELLGQMSSLIFAATDTTSNALARVFYLLAQHQAVQDRLRAEITEATEQNSGQDIPYETLVRLSYLDAVCKETLRVYPPVSLVRRITVKDTVIPLHNPVRGVDGRSISQIALPKNTGIIIPLMSSNRSPEIWGADSGEWKPERWLLPLPNNLRDSQVPGVYSHMMTFISGSRSCIGFKFSELEMKVVISLLIKTFRFRPSQHEIIWQMNPVASPTIEQNGIAIPTLPLVVEKI